MKSKVPLILMEQIIMLLVFALASALCLKAFVISDKMSRRSQNRDIAVTLVQDTAEMIKQCGGVDGAVDILGAEYDGETLRMYYDEEWNEGGSTFLLEAKNEPDETLGLGKARVLAEEYETKDILFEITVAWQSDVLLEAAHNGN
ncbi:hypothetical protein IMSAG049_01682 [Clostridiales bacterium]|nr:hypothetical protein IMSAG049_01682 [Clostridiales bacterium]